MKQEITSHHVTVQVAIVNVNTSTLFIVSDLKGEIYPLEEKFQQNVCVLFAEQKVLDVYVQYLFVPEHTPEDKTALFEDLLCF